MGRFSSDLKKTGKVYNHAAAMPAKVEIRRKVLDAVGAKSRVFDAFAGKGEMFKAVWQFAGGYVGCDKDWHPDERTCFVSDNRRVLRAIDLTGFQVFDLDAFGSPWEQAIIIAARRQVKPDEKLGLILTDGSGLTLKQGTLPNAIVELTGFKPRMAGLARHQDELIGRALKTLCQRMRCRIEKRWEAVGKTGAGVRYIGLVLVGEG